MSAVDPPSLQAGSWRRRLLRLAAFAVGAVVVASLVVTGSWLYTTLRLSAAAQQGVYATPEQGMRTLIEQNWREIHNVEIVYAGPNHKDGSDPHVGFVMVKVWAGSRLGGGKVGNSEGDFDYAGTFFLHTPQGWVHLEEDAGPEFVGFWMKVFGLAGE
jgi:hypothetical protein